MRNSRVGPRQLFLYFSYRAGCVRVCVCLEGCYKDLLHGSFTWPIPCSELKVWDRLDGGVERTWGSFQMVRQIHAESQWRESDPGVPD